jgi:CheY-like chemotaxis protein
MENNTWSAPDLPQAMVANGDVMYRHEGHCDLAGPKFDVLIVEDEPVSRRALAALVALRGYQTDSASSAEDALKRLSQNGLPRIALVDLDLPGMNGIEFIRRLEVLNPGVFPVLITAASGEVVDNIRRRFPVAYLRKPIDVDRLMNLIGEQGPASH